MLKISIVKTVSNLGTHCNKQLDFIHTFSFKKKLFPGLANSNPIFSQVLKCARLRNPQSGSLQIFEFT